MRPKAASIHPRIAAATAVIGSVSIAFSAAPAGAARADAATNLPPSVIVPPPTATARASAAAVPSSYTIGAGDTISAIAARFGLRTADVLAWNSLDWSTVIHPGQVIALSPPLAAAAAPSAAPAPTATPEAAAPAATHTVAGGDTLWAIARGSGVSVAALLAANGMDASSIIYPGQSIVIPAATASASDAAPAVQASAAPVAPASTTLDDEQIANARLIIQVGRSRGVSDRGIAIALAASAVESRIRNLDWGDRDSLGLFQQRPSTGWGTDAEVRDPARAAAAFFGGPDDPNGSRTRGLLDVPGWESMEFGAAAQAVQVSAYPERYGPWEQQAYAWLAALG